MVFTVLTFIFLISLTSIAYAQIIKIGTGQNPAIYGSKVTWSDTTSSIHVYDLTTKKDTKISSSKASYPAIYGNKIVWHDESSGVPRLTVYDMPSGKRSYITQNVDQYSIPKIYSNRIVWSANYNQSNYNYNVYMRDISTSIQTKIAYGEIPDIYDTKITYTYEGDEGPQVKVYDIVTKKTILVNNGSRLCGSHIYGNKVIGINEYIGSGYIELYDLTTKKSIDITHDISWNPETSSQAGDDTGSCTSIYGDKIVYAKICNDQFGNAGVYAYSISTGKSSPVINYPADVYTTPAVYGNTVAWGIDQPESSSVTGDKGIFVCDLGVKPIASFTANKVSGTHSLPVTFFYLGTGGGTPNSYYWDFGDKITSNHALNATHTYTKAGIYTVSLKVTNAAGSSTTTKTKYIKVT